MTTKTYAQKQGFLAFCTGQLDLAQRIKDKYGFDARELYDYARDVLVDSLEEKKLVLQSAVRLYELDEELVRVCISHWLFLSPNLDLHERDLRFVTHVLWETDFPIEWFEEGAQDLSDPKDMAFAIDVFHWYFQKASNA